MKKIILLLVTIFLVFGGLFAGEKKCSDPEKKAVAKVIEAAYVRGIHIDRDIDAIEKGFHPEFNMLVQKDDKLIAVPISKWIEKIKAIKEKKSEPAKVEVKHKFSMVSVAGNAAVARIEIFKNGKHVYSDFMSLYKFSDGWKIVSKIYYSHKHK